MHIEIPISLGELVDKISILTIKTHNIHDPEKREAARRELLLLESIFDSLDLDISTIVESRRSLFWTNQELWNIENELRHLEKTRNWGTKFTQLSRLVQQYNKQRSEHKNEINRITGSEITEIKEYQI